MKVGDQLIATRGLNLLPYDDARVASVLLEQGDRLEVISMLEKGIHAKIYYPAARLRNLASGKTCLYYTSQGSNAKFYFTPVSPLLLLAEAAEVEDE